MSLNLFLFRSLHSDLRFPEDDGFLIHNFHAFIRLEKSFFIFFFHKTSSVTAQRIISSANFLSSTVFAATLAIKEDV